MRVKFLDQAKEDLVEYNQYHHSVGGVALASKMLARIKEPVLALNDNPKIAPEYELAPGIRRLVVAGGTFLVFYRIADAIEVLHIRRAERMPVSAHELEMARSK
jgi:plasmid stabilization system protein ParE